MHTNTIEGAWAHAKNHFKVINGTNVRNFEGHIAEILWRNFTATHEVNIYESFFQLITATYTLGKPAEFNIPENLFGTWNPNFVDQDGVDRSIIQQIDAESGDLQDIIPSEEVLVHIGERPVVDTDDPYDDANVSVEEVNQERLVQ